ncbi:nucleoside deaminase [Roseovarius gaetbuli]|uniref:nucleoside deaminase n=1 Tax=Roseovarius gaetbuli TaxID=1356575 RepID=UPI00351FCD82
MSAHIRTANEVAPDAALHGHHPFSAVIVGPEDRILIRQGNIGTVRNAETELSRRAANAYPAEFLWTCTLVSTGEPCAMCTGTLNWTNIGRLLYGYEESTLLAVTGSHPANPTRSLDARTVLGSGQKPPCSTSSMTIRRRGSSKAHMKHVRTQTMIAHQIAQ